MADTTTTNLALTKPEPGASNNTWGTKLNTNLDTLDGIFKGDGTGTSVGLNVGSGKNLTLGGALKIGGATILDPTTPLPVANGGTGATSAAAAQAAILPSQTGNSGKYLTTNGTSASWSSSTTSPPGSNTQLVYNNNGSWGGATNLVYSNGYLGVGYSSPQYGIDARSQLGYFAGIGIGYTPQSGSLGVGGSGFFTGTVTQNGSDDRLKEDVVELVGALEKVRSLRAFTYKWNELARTSGVSGPEVGVSAQEVQRVLPEAVTLAPFDRDEHGNSASGENYLTVYYERLVPLLIAAVKELSARVEALER